MSLSGKQLFRAILRELKTTEGSQRQRAFLADCFKTNPTNLTLGQGNMMLEYLQSRRLYHQILAEVNPTKEWTEAERNKKAANLVGLNLPKVYSPSPASKDSSGSGGE